MSEAPPPPVVQSSSLGDFARKCVVAVVIASLAFLAWRLRHVIILGFAAVVVAVLIVAAADLVRRVAPLDRRWSVLAAIVGLIAILAATGWIAWPQVTAQGSDFVQRLPASAQAFEDVTGIDLMDVAEEMTAGDSGLFDRLWRDVLGFAGSLVSAITALVLVLAAGVFLALRPDYYRDGLVMLAPPRLHARFREALDRTGKGLRLWLVGQLAAMTAVGMLVGLGAWAIGLPAPLALAAIAFLTEFVPLLGPVVGAAPALLFASGEGLGLLLWTALLYTGIQQVEAAIITPLAQRQAVAVPPALFMLSVVGMGTLFGMTGVLLSGPLTVALFVLVRALYVEDALGEKVDAPHGV